MWRIRELCFSYNYLKAYVVDRRDIGCTIREAKSKHKPMRSKQLVDFGRQQLEGF